MEQIQQAFNFKSDVEFKKALREPPSEKWIKSRSLGGTRQSKYIPLFLQEAIADRIFYYWNVVKEDYDIFANEIVCVVTIEYMPSYPGAEIRTATGVGAKPIQQTKGHGADVFPKGKITNSLEYNAPASRASALSNCFTTLGNIMGRNLNRATSSGFSFNK